VLPAQGRDQGLEPVVIPLAAPVTTATRPGAIGLVPPAAGASLTLIPGR
jgi:hypothetical protein